MAKIIPTTLILILNLMIWRKLKTAWSHRTRLKKSITNMDILAGGQSSSISFLGRRRKRPREPRCAIFFFFYFQCPNTKKIRRIFPTKEKYHAMTDFGVPVLEMHYIISLSFMFLVSHKKSYLVCAELSNVRILCNIYLFSSSCLCPLLAVSVLYFEKN